MGYVRDTSGLFTFGVAALSLLPRVRPPATAESVTCQD